MKPRARTFAGIVLASMFAPALSLAVVALPFAPRVAHASTTRTTHAARSAESSSSAHEPSSALDAERVLPTEPAPEAAPEAAPPEPTKAAATVHAKAAPKPAPAPRAELAMFDVAAAQASLEESVVSLPICCRGEVSGPGVAEITWNAEGQVARIALSEPYAGTRTGACVARRFSQASVKPYEGPTVTLRTRFAL